MSKIDINHVETKMGPVSGFKISTRRDMNNNFCGTCDINAFFGIPYAEPPVGNLRFRPPRPVQAWTEIKKCEGHPAAMQKNFFGTWDFDCTTLDMSEDCLYLDIWSPAKDSEERLPVLVWIHGGAFLSGASLLSKYDMTNLASRGAVVVSVEYRIGIFAYLAHKWLSAESEDGISGNYGMLDCFEALKWINENIEAFGGDPETITLFGESSGGSMMTYFQTSPLTKGLVKRIIVESGTGAPTEMMTLSEAESMGEEVVDMLGCRSLEELRQVSAEEILDAQARLREEKDNRWEVIVDGKIMPDHVFNLYKEKKYLDVPTIFLTCEEDTPFFAEIEMPDELKEGMREAITEGFATGNVTDVVPRLSDKKSYDDYLKNFYGEERGAKLCEMKSFAASADMAPIELKKLANDLLSYYQTDVRARFYADIINENSKYGQAYVCSWGKVPKGWEKLDLGAFHELELAYLFNNIWLDFPQPYWDESDDRYSDCIKGYWINFAKTGDPNSSELPEWKPYLDDGEFLYFGSDDIVVKNDDREPFELFLPEYIERYNSMPKR